MGETGRRQQRGQLDRGPVVPGPRRLPEPVLSALKVAVLGDEQQAEVEGRLRVAARRGPAEPVARRLRVAHLDADETGRPLIVDPSGVGGPLEPGAGGAQVSVGQRDPAELGRGPGMLVLGGQPVERLGALGIPVGLQEQAQVVGRVGVAAPGGAAPTSAASRPPRRRRRRGTPGRGQRRGRRPSPPCGATPRRSSSRRRPRRSARAAGPLPGNPLWPPSRTTAGRPATSPRCSSSKRRQVHRGLDVTGVRRPARTTATASTRLPCFSCQTPRL